MECRFCDIEKKEPRRIVAVREHAVVLCSNPRLMKGHLLVVPKRHVLALHELSEAERKDLFDTAIFYQEKILRTVASGCDLVQHNRPFLPESDLKVDHVHLHLRPREFEDELYQMCQRHEREAFKPLADSEAEEITAALRIGSERAE